MDQPVAARPGGATNCEDDDEKAMVSSRGLCTGGSPAAGAQDITASKSPAPELGDGAACFPLFSLLPAELRYRIWHYFCAMIAAEPRVLDFQYRMGSFWDDIDWQAIPGRYLSIRVRAANTALAVNHECRSFALKAFPDTLAIKGDTMSGLVRFNKARDIVATRVFSISSHLQNGDFGRATMEAYGPFHVRNASDIIPGFSENVENLALDHVLFDSRGHIDSIDGDDSRRGMIWGFIGTFRNLKTLYHLRDHRVHALRDIHWCGSADAVNTYETLGLARVAYRRNRQVSITTVWPDPGGDPDFARTKIPLLAVPLLHMVELYDQYSEVEEDFWEMFEGVEVWPMVQFEGKSSQRVLERLRNTPRPEDLPDEEALSLDNPSYVATFDCDDPEGCLGHSLDGDLKKVPSQVTDWDSMWSEELIWGLLRKPDPFDISANVRSSEGDHYRPMRIHPQGDLGTYREDTAGILKSFSATGIVEQWLEGVCQDEGSGADEADQALVADMAELQLEVDTD